ncbi:MAG: amidohydrolase [Maricaulis sp.]|nr:amidohydrolase [Maricaulis sp.]
MRISGFLVSSLALVLAACGQSTDETVSAPSPVPEISASENTAEPNDGGIPAADTVYWGGRIYTANDTQPIVESVAVQDGRIVYTGPAVGAEMWIDGGTTIVDMNGGTMYPGFTDSHVHVFGMGQRDRVLNLDDVTSIAYLIERVAADRTEDSVYVYGRGWIETHYPEGRFPTRQDLDAAVPDIPVVLTRADGHASVSNSRALELAGVTRDTVAPDGGEILVDEAGEPTGMLIDTAQGFVYQMLGALDEASDEEIDPAERGDIYVEGAQVMASRGWTSAHDMSVPYSDIDMIEALSEAGRLPIRVYASVNPEAYAALAEVTPRISENGQVITRAVKLYMDGALGSRGAALLEPYEDRPESAGLMIAEADETISVFTEALRSGVQMNVHAIGDRGNRLLLDWTEEALAAVPVEERARIDHRWRDEHSQIVHPTDIPRFAELGVIASMQPSHAIGDLHFAPDRLGDDRLNGAYAWQSMLASGVHITGGSDAPVEQGDPRIEFYAAVARADLSGFQGDNWHDEQALTRLQALKLFTIWPAYASFQEDEIGSIELGKRADFTIFDRDIMVIPEPEILEAVTWMTVIDGQVAYEADNSFHQTEE